MQQTSIQDLFQTTRQEWLEECRAEAKRQLQYKPFVTSDDVTKVVPRPSYIHRNSAGSMFQNGEFVMVGVQKSSAKSRKGGWIAQWRLK